MQILMNITQDYLDIVRCNDYFDRTERLLPPPVILKPKPLWTGKQIFSLIVPQ